MKKIFSLALFTLCLIAASKAQHEWVHYKDDTYIKVFGDTFLGYDDAKEFCKNLTDPITTASLVMVKDDQMQKLLEEQTKDVLEAVWLGGKRDSATSEILWEDGEPVPKTDTDGWNNWGSGYPNAIADACMVLETAEAKQKVVAKGKWYHAQCARRNLFVCQKTQWSLASAHEQIQAIQDRLNNVVSEVLPVGFIYVEYTDQQTPEVLWPGMTWIWEDITEKYAGLFFRAIGGDSAAWGETQVGCAPKIIEMEYSETLGSSSAEFPVKITIPSSDWSEWVRAGYVYNSGNRYNEALRFKSDTCEIRPVNQAVRIWKRTA